MEIVHMITHHCHPCTQPSHIHRTHLLEPLYTSQFSYNHYQQNNFYTVTTKNNILEIIIRKKKEKKKLTGAWQKERRPEA